MQFIDLKAQYREIEDDVQARIQNVLAHGRFIMGPEVAELEAGLAEFTGSEHAIGVASGTDALLIALMALGVGAGDEVITTPFSFIATAEVIALIGAVPVFVDIEADTCNIDAALIEAAITPATKAIMPVSLYGQCADMAAINAIAAKHNLPVIEDAAQSFGAELGGQRSCNLSTIGCTSFFPSKPLGGYGDGGACFTNDPALAKLMREIRVHGQDRRYHHPVVGINGRLDTLQAAILLAKLPRFADEVAARGRIGARYTQQLSGHAGIQTPTLRPGRTSVYAQYTVRVQDRAAVVASLTAAEIPTAVHYPVPLSSQPALAQWARPCPQADQAAAEVLSLPMHPWLTEADQDTVIQALLAAVSG